jgi:hypothetical protein
MHELDAEIPAVVSRMVVRISRRVAVVLRKRRLEKTVSRSASERPKAERSR